MIYLREHISKITINKTVENETNNIEESVIITNLKNPQLWKQT